MTDEEMDMLDFLEAIKKTKFLNLIKSTLEDENVPEFEKDGLKIYILCDEIFEIINKYVEFSNQELEDTPVNRKTKKLCGIFIFGKSRIRTTYEKYKYILTI